MLAGISADYYLRLEQGRDRNPSIQVLEALARVLHLDQAATDYLLGLAAPRPVTGGVAPGARPCQPVSGNCSTSCACPRSSRAGTSTSSPPTPSPAPCRPTWVGREPAPLRVPRPGRAERSTRTGMAPPPGWSPGSRESGGSARRPRFIELVGELSLSSARFRRRGRGTTCYRRGRRPHRPSPGGRPHAEPREADHHRSGGRDTRHLPPRPRHRRRRQTGAPGLPGRPGRGPRGTRAPGKAAA